MRYVMQVLQTGQEINELDHSGFSTTTRTLHVANLGGRKYILQVSPTTIRLLEGGVYIEACVNVYIYSWSYLCVLT